MTKSQKFSQVVIMEVNQRGFIRIVGMKSRLAISDTAKWAMVTFGLSLGAKNAEVSHNKKQAGFNTLPVCL